MIGRRGTGAVTAIVPAVMALTWAMFATAAGALFVTDATIEHDGLTRYYDYYVPDGLPSGPVPLLFVLHGGTQSKDALKTGPMSEFRWLADREQFVVVFPNGTDPTTGLSGPSGSFNWNDCRNDAGPSTTTADDVGFIGALIDWAAASFSIDLDRVYATGASNGGMMSYRLALELSHRIAAVGAIVANLPANSECVAAPAHPLAVLIMNGTAETFFMPWNGGTLPGNRGEVRSATETRDFWRTVLGTDPVPYRLELPDLDGSDGGHVALDIYRNGAEGTRLYFYTVNGAGHTVPSIKHPLGPGVEALLGKQNRDIEAAAEVWNFLRQQGLNGPVFHADHYRCYGGRDLNNPRFTRVAATLSDQIIANEPVAVQKVKFVCVPANKNGEGISDPTAHLTCYQIKAGDLSPRPNVEVSTQFQVSRFQLKKGKLLCVPSSQSPLQ